MNLIMSDVEETIMIVDPESAANGRGVVNVGRNYVRPTRPIDAYLCRLPNVKWRCYS